MPKVGLCLSGGGFRASLIHAGVLLRLEELGILKKHVKYISSVSGGSITSAIYGLARRRRGNNVDIYKDVCCSLISGIKKAPINRFFIFTLIYYFAPLVFSAIVFFLIRNNCTNRFTWTVLALALLLSILWLHETGQRVSAKALFVSGLIFSLILSLFWPVHLVTIALCVCSLYLIQYIILHDFGRDVMPEAFKENFCFSSANVADLIPTNKGDPHFIFNTTSLSDGAPFYITDSYIGLTRANALRWTFPQPQKHPSVDISLADAVAASACVPGLFDPIKIGDHVLGDGGIFDNIGLTVFIPPLGSPGGNAISVDVLIISDASRKALPDEKPISPIPFWKTYRAIERAFEITFDSVRQHQYKILDYKKLRSKFEFAVFGLSANSSSGNLNCLYSFIPKMRTDLDSFSDLEIRLLMFYGYTMVNQRIQQWCPTLIPKPPPRLKDWDQFNENLDKQPVCVIEKKKWPRLQENFLSKDIQDAINHLRFSHLHEPWRSLRRCLRCDIVIYILVIILGRIFAGGAISRAIGFVKKLY